MNLSEYVDYLVDKYVKKYGMKILFQTVHKQCTDVDCFFSNQQIPVWNVLQSQTEFSQRWMNETFLSCMSANDLLNVGDELLPDGCKQEIWSEVQESSFYLNKKITSENLFFNTLFLEGLKKYLINNSPFSFMLHFDESKRYASFDDCDLPQNILEINCVKKSQNLMIFNSIGSAIIVRDFILETFAKINMAPEITIHGFSGLDNKKLDWFIIDQSINLNQVNYIQGKESVANKWINSQIRKSLQK